MDNKTEVITIEAIIPSPYGVKITAQDKKIYNVSKTKKDGTETTSWQQLITMGLKGTDPITGTPGSTVEIWFKEVPNNYNSISRYIQSFRESNGQLQEKPQTNDHEQFIASHGLPQSESREEFGKKLAVHGFINAQITYKGLENIGDDDIGAAIFLAEEIALELKKPVGWKNLGTKLKESAIKPEPIITDAIEDDIDSSDIPF